MQLSPLDQRFLDLMDRLEQIQQQHFAAFARQLDESQDEAQDEARQLNQALEQRVAALEAQNTRMIASLTSLNDSLARLLGPSVQQP